MYTLPRIPVSRVFFFSRLYAPSLPRSRFINLIVGKGARSLVAYIHARYRAP